MRVIEKDLKHGIIKIVPENPDDLWILYNIVKPGDIVTARSTREVKGDESSSSRRIPMIISIRVKALEFQPFTTRLRIRGIVVDAPDKYGVKGKHHTINVEPGTILVVEKKNWRSYELRKLEEASLRRGMVILVAIDYDEASIGVLSSQGLRIIASIRSGFSSKRYGDPGAVLEKYYENVAAVIEKLYSENKISAIIVGGPGFAKDSLYALLTQRLREAHVIIDTASMGGRHGLWELARRDSVLKALKQYEIIEANRILGEFKRLLITNPDRVAYGLDDVEYSVKMNAVRTILVAESMLHSSDEDLRRRLDEILAEADRRAAAIHIAPFKSDVEYELLGFGGIVALLRYSLPRDNSSSI